MKFVKRSATHPAPVIILVAWFCFGCVSALGQDLPIEKKVGYQLDPLLRAAYEKYLDEEAPRVEAITLFEKYLESNPDSEFLPEIYFRIGALYSIHRRETEPLDRDKQRLYYEKSHELYGKNFDHAHNAAWASLANFSDSLEEKAAYYDWLLRLRSEDSSVPIHPIRHIGQTLNGRFPQLQTNAVDVRRGNISKVLSLYMDSAEQNIISSVSDKPVKLAILAERYRDTPLGKMAKEHLDAR